jgi:hypothetical protein
MLWFRGFKREFIALEDNVVPQVPRPGSPELIRIFLCVAVAVLFAQVTTSRAQIRVGPNVLVSKAHSELVHDEVLLNADPSNPDRLIGCSLAKTNDGILVSAGTPPWYGIAYMSDDAGKTWRLATEFKHTETAVGLDNHCAFGVDGTAFFITGVAETSPAKSDPPRDDLDHKPDSYDYLLSRRSTDGGHTWSDWLTVVQGTYTDRQYIIADDTNGKYRGRVYITGQSGVRSVDNEDQGTALTLWRSLDSGATYERPLKRLGAKLESLFNPWNPVIMSDGTLALPFIDISGITGEGGNKQPYVLKIVFSRDGGDSFSKSYKIADIRQNPPIVHTPYVLAVDRSEGPFKDRLYMTWADEKAKHSEVLLSYSADKGKTWSKPIIVNDDRPRPIKNALSDKGPDDDIPAVTVNRGGIVGLMWYDRRDFADNQGYWARFSASLDGGETWSPSVKVSEKPNTYMHGEIPALATEVLKHKDDDKAPKDPNPHVGVDVGRYEWITGGHTSGLAADGAGRFHALWIDNRTGIHQVYSSQIDVTGAAVKNGSPALADLADVSDKVDLQVLSTSYDEKAQTVTISARLKNHSKDTLRGPMKARVVVLQSDFAVPHVANADNQMAGTGAVWDFSSLLNNGELKPDETTQAKTLLFHLQDVWPLDISAHEGVYNRSLVNFEAKVLAKQ